MSDKMDVGSANDSTTNPQNTPCIYLKEDIMNEHFWRAISLESIDPLYFPAVPLFTKMSGNYVLYKDAERKFTAADRSRLKRTCTELMYVRAGDMAEISAHLESSLADVLTRKDLDSVSKGKIFYQVSINYLIDAFEEPEQALNLERCQQLVKHMMEFVAQDENALQAIHAVASNNFFVFAHSVQVMALNLLAHEKLFHVDPDELTDVGIGSLLHDYGMVFISSDVSKKADAIADIEFYKVKQHTQKGYESLRDSGMFSEMALTIVRHHHERYDGDGFPAGIKGNNIPRSAQLSALCDTYSSLTLGKAPRKALPHQEAIKSMREESGKAFSPEILSSFIELVSARKSD